MSTVHDPQQHTSGRELHATPRRPAVRRRCGAAPRAGPPCRAAVMVVACLVAQGCRQPRPPDVAGASDLSGLPPLRLSSPVDAARTLLVYLQAEQRAIRSARPDLAARVRQALRGVVAEERVRSRSASALRAYMPETRDVLDAVLQNWSATIAYYAEGLELDALSPAPGSDEGQVRFVFAPASRGSNRVAIRIECLREGDLWRIAGVELEPPRGWATAPSPPDPQP